MPTLYLVEDRIQEKTYQLQLPWVRGKILTNVLLAEYEGQTLELRPHGRDGVYMGKIGNTRIYDEGNLRALEQGLIDIADVMLKKKVERQAEYIWQAIKPRRMGGLPGFNSAMFIATGIATGIF